MKSIIRKDEAVVSSVSPHTLCYGNWGALVSALDLMVSGLITGPGGTPQAMGVSVQPSSDGSNWIVLVLSTRSEERRVGKAWSTLYGDGSENLNATAFE